MAESTLPVNRWTPTRKAAVALAWLRGADVVERARLGREGVGVVAVAPARLVA